MTNDHESKVFLMWAGELSRQVALLLHELLPDLMPTVKPFMSSESIRKGQQWSAVVTSQLEESRFGIACITVENLDERWIHFEAGAIAKHASHARVATLRVNVDQAQITGPLSLFQSTSLMDENDFLKLLIEIDASSTAPGGADRLRRVMPRFWPEFHSKVLEAIRLSGEPPAPQPPRPGSPEAMLQEILQLSRNTHRVLAGEEPRNEERVLGPDEQRRPRTPLTEDGRFEFEKARGTLRTVVLTAKPPMEAVAAMRDWLLNEGAVVVKFDGSSVRGPMLLWVAGPHALTASIEARRRGLLQPGEAKSTE